MGMFKVLISITVFLLMITVASGQAVSVAQISGTVTDTSGAVIPGAQVAATNVGTGETRSTTTDGNGFYTIPNLAPGQYNLEFSKTGFGTFRQMGITLQVNTNPTINAQLKIGTATQQVEVTADAPLVETHSTGVGQVVENQRIVDLPLNGRQATQLISLAPASLPAPPAAFQSPRNYPTITLSVAGGSAAGLFFVLDGGNYNDVENNLNLPLPFPDAINEFKVETSAVSARYGYHGAGVVNMVTMAGSNSFHGDAFDFVRNYMFNARNPYATSRDSLKRNQFGGTLGGPIRRNKLFFFGGYQGTITRSNPATSIMFVPSEAMLTGDFTQAASSACNGGKAVTLLAPFVNNMIASSAFSGVSLGYEKYLPSTTDPCGKFQFGLPNNSTEDLGTGRVDYVVSARQSLFGRYVIGHYNIPYLKNGDALLTTQGQQVNQAQSFVLGHTYTFSSSFINSVRATLNRTRNDRIPVPFYSPTDFGVNITDLTNDYSALTVTNAFDIGSSLANLGHWNSTFVGLADDVDRFHGSHHYSFGISYFYAVLNALGNQYSNGQFTFNGQNTNLPLADFLLGLPSNFTQGRAQVESERMHHIALYAQDSWKISRKLTFNYGLRWEPWFPMTEARGHVEHFDLAAFEQGVTSRIYTNAPPGLSFPGDAGFPGDATTSKKWSNFAPRIGLIFDPMGNGKQVVRAAYGIFYDLPSMYYNVRTSSAPPFGNTTGVNNPSFADPWLGFTGGNPFTQAVTSSITFPVEAVYINYPLHTNPPYLQQWNLSYQRQLSANWAVTIGYLGNKTTHLWLTQEDDPAVYIAGSSTKANTNQRRVLYLMDPTTGVYYSTLEQLDDGGNAAYNGAYISAEKRFSQGFSMFANYTWSHCFNDGEDYEALGVLLSYQNPSDRAADWGPCASDRRNVFNVSGVFHTPAFTTNWLHTIGSGWQLALIVQAMSGDALTITDGGLDYAFTGTSNQRPNVTANPTLAGNTRSLSHWFNTSVFVPNSPGQYGDAAKGIVRGPGMTVVNTALMRDFAIRERRTIEFRVEAFNLLNHIQPMDPNTKLGSALFGQVSTAGDPRIMQFALKYIF